jgi:hypothetical protein
MKEEWKEQNIRTDWTFTYTPKPSREKEWENYIRDGLKLKEPAWLNI